MQEEASSNVPLVLPESPTTRRLSLSYFISSLTSAREGPEQQLLRAFLWHDGHGVKHALGDLSDSASCRYLVIEKESPLSNTSSEPMLS